jgi:glycosyltransferase involved in cell wall biosynthesis
MGSGFSPRPSKSNFLAISQLLMDATKNLQKAINIAVLASQFTESNSGLEFLKYIMGGILNAYENTGSKIHLFIPLATFEKSRFIENSAMNISTYMWRLRIFNIVAAEDIARKINNFLPRLFPINKTKLRHTFKEFDNSINIVFYYSPKNLLREIHKREINVILPATTAWGRECHIPWIGYIADCQHKYFPEYFADFELVRRDHIISSLLSSAGAIIVNSESTKNDLIEFYNGDDSKIYNLPFAPVADPSWFEDSPDIIKKYALPQKYFIISNRLWVHKSHVTAFEALAKINEQGYRDIGIICTGEMQDYRDPHIENKLRNKIKTLNLTDNVEFLGLIDKKEQIEIMKNAIAVLQPTLFEGGPGGGAVYNALALGKPAIVSDIRVNLELRGQDNVIFFEAKNADDMAEKMKVVLENRIEIKEFSKEELIFKSKIHLDRHGHKIKEIIDFVVNNTEA